MKKKVIGNAGSSVGEVVVGTNISLDVLFEKRQIGYRLRGNSSS